MNRNLINLEGTGGTGPENSSITRKTKTREFDRKVVTLLFTTGKQHSSFLMPHSLDYIPDSKLATSNQSAKLELEKRIKLGYWDTPSIQLLAAALEFYINVNHDGVGRFAQQTATKLSRVMERSIQKKQERQSNQYEAISLHLQGTPHKIITSKVKVKPKTLKKWIQLFDKGQLFKQPANAQRQHQTQKYLDAICGFLSHSKRVCSTLSEIKRYLLDRFAMELPSISISTISKWVKKAGFSRKRLSAVVKDRNGVEMVQKRKKAAIEISQHISEKKEIIYIDEVSFNQDMVPIYGYSQIGKPAFATKRVKGENFSVVAAVTNRSFLGFQIFKTSIAAQEFGFFLVSLLKAYPEICKARSNYIFFMDNARTHKAKAIKDLLSEIIVCYSAPYSPFLNPIEEVFSTWKHYYRKLIYEKEASVVSCICESAKAITPHKLKKCWVHSLEYTLRSLREEKIE